MSVYREDVIKSEGGEVSRVMIGHEGYALATLTAGQVRFKYQTVFPAPLPGESSHAHVCGRKTRATRSWFSRKAAWVIPPPSE